MAEGSTRRSPQRDVTLHQQELSDLADIATKAASLIGAASVTLHGLPDNRMDLLELLDVIKIVEGEIERRKPDVVLTHHFGDLNIDHRIVHECVLTACRPQPGNPTKQILFFEVPSYYMSGVLDILEHPRLTGMRTLVISCKQNLRHLIYMSEK